MAGQTDKEKTQDGQTYYLWLNAIAGDRRIIKPLA